MHCTTTTVASSSISERCSNLIRLRTAVAAARSTTRRSWPPASAVQALETAGSCVAEAGRGGHAAGAIAPQLQRLESRTPAHMGKPFICVPTSTFCIKTRWVGTSLQWGVVKGGGGDGVQTCKKEAQTIKNKQNT